MYIVQERTNGSFGRFKKVKEEFLVVIQREFSFFCGEYYTVEDKKPYYCDYGDSKRQETIDFLLMTPEKDKITETLYVLVVTPEIDKRQNQ
jgi:hypothetical protein